MKILVTGHKGFIGSHMAQYLVHKGHEVEGFDYVENVVPAVDQYDWVIHLGAISDTTERDVNKVWKHNYEFTLRLLQVCDHYSTNIQLASTAAVYGPNTAFNEQDPVYPQTPYAWSKYLIDKFLLDNGIDQFNALVQSYRYFNVYGPGEGHKGDQMSMVSKFQRQASEDGKIKLFKKDEALFQETGIEDQLSAMFNPVVPLPSGGYLVINPTEALVSVDVNSGRSTKEHSVEKTALKTNLEAATEIARQMRLRDLAGLLVIDFIDMDENRNNRAVERRIKDALKKDRARIQVGKISPFGLLEMSRQRMRSGVLEGSSEHCSHCNGTGMVRSIESRALHVLRRIEQEAVSLKDQNDKTIEVKVPREVAEYILNYKRTHLVTIESNSGCLIVVSSDEALNAMEMSISSAVTRNATQIRMDGNPEITPGGEEEPSGRKRRRRGKRGSGDGSNDNARDNYEDNQQASGSEDEVSPETNEKPSERADGFEDDDDKPRRRRRGRRGGRRRRKASSEYDENYQANGDTVDNGEASASDNTSENVSASELPPAPPFEFSQNDDINDGLVITSPAPMNPEESPAEADVDAAAEDKPAKKPRRAPRKKKQEDNVDATSSETSAPEETPKPKTVAKKPRRSPRKKASTKEGTSAPETSSAQEPPVEVVASENIETKSEGIDANDGEKRSGWWRR